MANSKEQVLASLKAQTDKLNAAFAADSKLDAKQQEEALYQGNLLLVAIDEKVAGSEDLKALIAKDAEYEGKRKALTELLKKDTEQFDKKHSKTYSFNQEFAKGDVAGKKAALAAGELGQDINEGATGLWATIKGWFSGSPKKKDANGNEVEELDENGQPKKTGIAGLLSNFNVGGIVGSILGIGGAFMAGNIFGGGIVGTIAKWLLVPALAIMGNKWGKNTINPWMGRDADGNDLAKGQTVEHARGQQKVLEIKKDGTKETENSKANGKTDDVKNFTEEEKTQLAEIMQKYKAPVNDGLFTYGSRQTAPDELPFTYGPRPAAPVNTRG